MKPNNKELEVRDYIQIEDSNTKECPKPVIGMITIYDDNGNIVCQKHNMVVKSGRQLIFNLFKNCFTPDSKKISGNLFLNLSYKNNYLRTTADLTLADIKDSTNNSFNKQLKTIDDQGSNLSLSFTADITATDNFKQFNQIYLSYTLNEGSQEILFSRVALDPVFLGPTGKYKITYKLYF